MKKILLPLFLLLALQACSGAAPLSTPSPVNRYTLLPAEKYTPEIDSWPPVIASPWSLPVPLPSPLNTSGGEDSPFITPDNRTLYFFFTPNVAISPEKQLLDGVTGIWSSHRAGDTWTEPVRIWLEAPGEMALDGCDFVLGNEMWFCSTRQGNFRTIDFFQATLRDGKWTGWRNAGRQLNETFQIGEMHLSSDGQDLYFASGRPGGFGGLDLWVTHKNGDAWGEPVNLGQQVNSVVDENRPFVSADGKQLWFDAPSRIGRPGPAIYMSLLQADGSWGSPQEVVSNFAGEPNLSADGKTLYFVHHYYTSTVDRMLEADIYVSIHP